MVGSRCLGKISKMMIIVRDGAGVVELVSLSFLGKLCKSYVFEAITYYIIGYVAYNILLENICITYI